MTSMHNLQSLGPKVKTDQACMDSYELIRLRKEEGGTLLTVPLRIAPGDEIR